MKKPAVDFKRGDEVELNSGGPPMLVLGTVKGVLICAWIDDDGIGRCARWDPRVVRLIPSESPVQ